MIRDYALQAHNTLAIPATAQWFAVVESVPALRKAIEFANQHQLSILPLGEGSNIVLAADYPGLVLQNKIGGLNVVTEDQGAVTIDVGGGENWHALVKRCIANGWYGIENLALIPGSVGAAPIQNIGAYGVELADVLVSLQYLRIGQTQSAEPVQTYTKAQCLFGYRDSIFKQALRDQTMVISVRLKLSKHPVANVSYPAVKQWLADKELAASPQSAYAAVCSLRKSKLPDPKKTPNAGSFFKNPIVTRAIFKPLIKAYPNMPHYHIGKDRYKLAAAWMIEQAGWKGRDCDTTGMHAKQALVLVNPAQASGSQVLQLAATVQSDVAKRFGIELEMEPRVYPQNTLMQNDANAAD